MVFGSVLGNFIRSDLSLKRLPLQFFHFRKLLYHRFRLRQEREQQKTLFILGCQRSGTTLISEIFQKDFNSIVFGERALSRRDWLGRIRLDPAEDLIRILKRTGAPLVVLKPLVESQRARQLLDEYPAAKALWAFRDYRDIVASNLRKFGLRNGIRNLHPIIEEDPSNWRSEKVSKETSQVIKCFFSWDMDPYDAAALFWWARNRLFFEQSLEDNADVMLVRYEELVSEPLQTMERVYEWLGIPFPSARVLTAVHHKSRGKGASIQLSPAVEELCSDLLKQLTRIWLASHSRRISGKPASKTSATNS